MNSHSFAWVNPDELVQSSSVDRGVCNRLASYLGVQTMASHDASHSLPFAIPRSQVYYWTTPIPQCLDGSSWTSSIKYVGHQYYRAIPQMFTYTHTLPPNWKAFF